MKITVIGCGRWGSFIAWLLDRLHHEVTLYGRENSASMQRWIRERRNDLIELPASVSLSTELSCMTEAEVVVISVGAQDLRALMGEIALLSPKNKIFVLCMKGLEMPHGERLSVVASEFLDPSNRIAIWVGPGHVQEFYRGIPNCMVIDSEDEETKHLLVDAFSGGIIRFYYGSDMLGNEIGAASKNVIGIAAGFLDGLSLSSLKGALMSRGTHEIAALIGALGGNPFSAYGLCHLGDYEATVFSAYSHNRRFGEAFVRGEPYHELAEGYATARAIMSLGETCGVELPICRGVYEILYEGKDAYATLNALFTREIKNEF
jgi:glycerol-3-phosphate dehydrogenase